MILILLRIAFWLCWMVQQHHRPAGRPPQPMDRLIRRDLAAFSARASTPARPHEPG